MASVAYNHVTKASPREIDDDPVNMYVAGFIGSPKMNFIPVTVSGGTARASSFSLELPKAPGIEQGVLGLRPEDLTEVRMRASQRST